MQIGVSYGSITALQDNCNNTATKISSIIDDLNAQLAPLAASWTGNAHDAYQNDQTKWTTGQQDLSKILQTIGSSLSSVNEQYQKTETTNTGMFYSSSGS